MAPPRAEEAPAPRALVLLLAGALLAGGALAAVVAVVYRSWYLQEMSQDAALWVAGALFCLYAVGVYIFAYGWERGDVPRALRLTAVVVVLSAVAALLLVVALAALSKARGVTKAAGATAAGEDEGADLGRAVRVLGSYVDDGVLVAPAAPAPPSDMFTIDCHGCGQRYIPLPPKAACPNCGWAAVTVA